MLHEALASTQKTLQLVKEHLAKSNTISAPRKLELRIPTFDADKRDRPKRYIKELKKYIELADSENDLYQVINEGMKNSANDWWYAVQDSVHTFREFEIKFLNRYWNNEIQKKLKTQLAMGKFNREGKLTRVEYAIRMSNHARDLNIPENDAVSAIGEHFDKETANAIWGWKIKTLDDLIEFLERVDTRKFNSTIKNDNENNSPRPKPWQINKDEKKIQSVRTENAGTSQGKE